MALPSEEDHRAVMEMLEGFSPIVALCRESKMVLLEDGRELPVQHWCRLWQKGDPPDGELYVPVADLNEATHFEVTNHGIGFIIPLSNYVSA